MAKTIKFNLICDEKPVRTIEDLQNNFSIEDVLAYYDNQLLHRWLRVRGYNSELEAVSAITSKEPMDVIKELIRIFDVAADEEKVEESIYMLRYLEERKECCAIYERENYNAKHIIEDYEAGYRQLVDGIFENPDDAAVIKANIAEIVSNYAWILKLDHRRLFYSLRYRDSFLAIMCLLMNEESRKYYLPSWIDDDDDDDDDDGYGEDIKEIYTEICDIIESDFDNFVDALGENLIAFSGDTDSYWKDLESKGRRYMIISMEYGNKVRSCGKKDEELNASDVNQYFVILNGVDYKSNSAQDTIYYMEV